LVRGVDDFDNASRNHDSAYDAAQQQLLNNMTSGVLGGGQAMLIYLTSIQQADLNFVSAASEATAANAWGSAMQSVGIAVMSAKADAEAELIAELQPNADGSESAYAQSWDKLAANYNPAAISSYLSSLPANPNSAQVDAFSQGLTLPSASGGVGDEGGAFLSAAADDVGLLEHAAIGDPALAPEILSHLVLVGAYVVGGAVDTYVGDAVQFAESTVGSGFEALSDAVSEAVSGLDALIGDNPSTASSWSIDAAVGSGDSAYDLLASATVSGGAIFSQQDLSGNELAAAVTFSGSVLYDALPGAAISTDASGNIVLVNGSAAAGDASTLTIAPDGSTASYVTPGANFTFGQSSLSSIGSSGFSTTFTLNGDAVGVGGSITWDADTGKALLNLDGSIPTSLGYVNVGGSLQVSGSTINVYDVNSQLQNSTQVFGDGSQADISYNLGPGASAETVFYYNATGQQTGVAYVNKDGSAVSDTYDPQTGILVQQDIIDPDGSMQRSYYGPDDGSLEATISLNPKGNITNQYLNPSISLTSLAGVTIDALAGQAISDFLLANNMPASIAAQAFAHTSYLAITGQLPNGSVSSANFLEAYSNQVAGMAAGIVGSDAGEALFKALGLTAEPELVVGGIVGSVATQDLTSYLVNQLTQVIDQSAASQTVATLAGAFANFSVQIESAGAGALASYLEGLLGTNSIGPGSTIGGDVGSAIGYFLGAGSPLTPLFVFIGDFIGSFIGGLFGPGPSVGPLAYTFDQFDSSTNQFISGISGEDNNGDESVPQSMVSDVNSELNSIISSIGGKVLPGEVATAQYDASAPNNNFSLVEAIYIEPNAEAGLASTAVYPDFQIGYYKGQFYDNDWFASQALADYTNHDATSNTFSNANDAVSDAIFRMLHDIRLQGGNPYMEFTLAESLSNTLSGLISDLNVAHDYSVYIANPLAFDAALALTNEPQQISAWQAELQQANDIGLTRLDLTGAVPTIQTTPGGLALDTVVADVIFSGTYDLIVSGVTAANAQSEAALPHVIELKVIDVASAVAANLDGLEPMAVSDVLHSITMTDAGTPILQVAPYQLTADSAALAVLTAPYQVWAVVSGGTQTDNSVVEVYSSEFVQGGGLVSATVLSGGSLIVESGGLASGTVNDGGVEIVSAGGVSFAALVNVGDQDVSGEAIGAVLVSGVQDVLSGGTASGTIIDSAGNLYIESGGQTISGRLSGGAERVMAGGAASWTVIDTGWEDIAAGASAFGAVVSIGAQDVFGVASQTDLVSGTQAVDSGGLALATLIGADSNDYVSRGGVLTGATVSGGSERVYGGGVTEGATLDTGYEEVFAGGSASGTRINSGSQDVYGVASGTILVSGAEVVQSGGVASGTMVETPSNVWISAGGLLSGAVLQGGVERVLSGGVAIATSMTISGYELISSGGVTSGTTITVGAQDVYGSASGTVLIGGTEDVDSGGLAVGTVIDADGFANVLSAATLRAATVNGGIETVLSGGLAVGATLLSGGIEAVSSGGTASASVISIGYQTVAGTASDAVVDGGEQYILSGGAAQGTQLLAGEVFVESGASDSGAMLQGGAEEVAAGGSVADATVESAGLLTVFSGAQGQRIIVAGGQADILGGASLEGGVLTSGGMLVVSSGGSDVGTDVGAGGLLVLAAGATASGLNLQSGAIIDLIDTPGATSASIGAAGQLVVASNGKTEADIGLAGAIGMSFTIEADGDGGTDIVVSAPQASGGSMSPYTISSGVVSSGLNLGSSALAYVLDGGTLLQTEDGGLVVVSSGGIALDAVVSSGGTLSLTTGASGQGVIVQSGGVLSGAGQLAGSDTLAGLASGLAVVGQVEVLPGGQAARLAIGAGGEVDVSAGGADSGSRVGNLGEEVVLGGSVTNVAVASGGLEVLGSGASAIGVTIRSGGGVELDSAVVSEGMTVTAGTVSSALTVSGVTVLSGGSIQFSDPVVSSGGTIDLVSDGVVSSPTVLSGGSLSGSGVVHGDGVVAGVISLVTIAGGPEDATGAFIDLQSGGVASGVAVSPTGALTIEAGASAISTVDAGEVNVAGQSDGATVLAGGYEYVYAGLLPDESAAPGGVASGGLIRSGGTEEIGPGGTAVGTVVDSGALEIVDFMGAASGVTISSGGEVDFDGLAISGGQTVVVGTASSTVMLSGVALMSGAALELTDATVLSGAGADLASGAVASSFVVASGGLLSGAGFLGGDNVVSGSVVSVSLSGSGYAGPTLDLVSGGQATDVAVDGGTLTIESGAVAIGDQVLDGGEQLVSSGAVASGAVVGAGGVLLVLSGGSAQGVEVEAGGVLQVQAGAIVSDLTLAAGGAVDLEDVASASAAVTASDGLSISSGGASVATLGLAGQATDWLVSTSDDGSGGTEILASAGPFFAPLSGAVTSAGGGEYTDDTLYAPGGVLVGSESILVSGGRTQDQFFGSNGAQFAATIEQNLGGGETELQDFNGAWVQTAASINYALGGGSTLAEYFDGSWDHLGATYTTVNGASTIVQDFDGSWKQLSATNTTSTGDMTVVQDFNSAWDQVSAELIVSTGAETITQYFNSSWTQVSASIVTTDQGTIESQFFNSDWQQVSATIVTHPSTNQTTTQNFDGAWNQLSADIATVSGGVTTDQQFNGGWQRIGGTVTSALNAETDLVQHYDAQWDQLLGQDQLIVEVQSGLQVFADDPGVPTTYVIRPGDLNGDAFTGFVTAAANPFGHDVLEFEGYGPGAALTEIDPGHWQISAPGHAAEVFTLAGTLNPAAGDVIFG
jgi:autotransporter passenger strand-loop-strand repeat protein